MLLLAIYRFLRTERAEIKNATLENYRENIFPLISPVYLLNSVNRNSWGLLIGRVKITKKFLNVLKIQAELE